MANRIRAVSLRHLRAFLAVVESGGLTAASERLRRSVSAISRSVSLLEELFGQELLDCDRSKPRPTLAGALVARRCDGIRAELESCRDQLIRFHGATPPPFSAMFEMMVDSSHLQALVAAQEFRSLQRAAQVLGVSQPAVSYSIRLLEADIGSPLFTRVPNGMISTPAGLTASITARRVIAEVRRMADDVQSAGGVSTGEVCVGALAYSRTALLPQTIRQVLEQYPNVIVRTVEGHIEHLVSALHAAELDLVLCAYPDRALLDGVEIDPIAMDHLGMFVRAGHPLAGRKGVTFDELLEFRFIMPPVGTITRKLLEEFFAENGHPAPTGQAETSSYSLVRNLLIGSDHIAFRSMREFCSGPSETAIVPLDLAVPAPPRQICVLQRRGAHPTAAVNAVLDTVRYVARRDAGDAQATPEAAVTA